MDKEIIQYVTGVSGLSVSAYKLWKTYHSKIRSSYETYTKDFAKITLLCKKSNEGLFSRIVLFSVKKERNRFSYVEAIAEWVSGIKQSVLDDFSTFTPDDEYIDMLYIIQSGETIKYVIKDIPEGALKNIYTSSGISISIITKVYETKRKMYYISFASESGEITSERLKSVTVIGSHLEDLLKKYF